jgi:S1-C subfamily serine protease
VRVVRVEAGTPAADGGLSGGDLLLAANATAVATLDDLARVLVLGHPDALDVEVLRAGARQRLVLRPRARAA